MYYMNKENYVDNGNQMSYKHDQNIKHRYSKQVIEDYQKTTQTQQRSTFDWNPL